MRLVRDTATRSGSESVDRYSIGSLRRLAVRIARPEGSARMGVGDLRRLAVEAAAAWLAPN